MKLCRIYILVIVSLLLLCPQVQSWGNDGHLIARLSKAAAIVVKKLLPASAGNDLAKACSWADQIRTSYRWSTPLHYIDTPKDLCTYQYKRDCKDHNGVKDRCVAGAINNNTNQLLTYRKPSQYNLTEALLFLSHFIGDIHQPLNVGFASDKGGNLTYVYWYNKRVPPHRVWDTNIIETEAKRFYSSNVTKLISHIQLLIRTVLADQVHLWEACGLISNPTCPDICASESIKTACLFAYKGVRKNIVLKDDYLMTRSPIVIGRLVRAGVRLAATLNRIFK